MDLRFQVLTRAVIVKVATSVYARLAWRLTAAWTPVHKYIWLHSRPQRNICLELCSRFLDSSQPVGTRKCVLPERVRWNTTLIKNSIVSGKTEIQWGKQYAHAYNLNRADAALLPAFDSSFQWNWIDEPAVAGFDKECAQERKMLDIKSNAYLWLHQISQFIIEHCIHN